VTIRSWLLAAVPLVLTVTGCASEPTEPTSIVLVTLDTLRVDHVGAYHAGATSTPELDQLAEGALLHENAFTTMPTTAPAHLSLFTGLHPSQHGSRRNGARVSLARVGRDLAGRLAAAGFATAAFTTTSLLTPQLLGLQGFQVFDAPSLESRLRPGREAVEAALRWLRTEQRRPIFLWVHLYDPHAPYGDAAGKMDGLPLDAELYGWVTGNRLQSPAERARMRRLYAAGVADMDSALGLLLDAVAASLGSAPLVVVAGDHGEHLEERLDEYGYANGHGAYLEEETLRIPMLLAGPGVEPGRSSGAVSIRDLYTTLLRAGGLQDPLEATEGRRDLRVASDERRIVVVERRLFRSHPKPGVQEHDIAATDGAQLLILAEDGSVTRGADAPTDLLEAARARARNRFGLDTPPATDAQTREALEALGYAE